jgi:hypothetical protein
MLELQTPPPRFVELLTDGNDADLVLDLRELFSP